MLTKIVAKKKDGSMIKGTTGDFLPFRNTFHMTVDNAPDVIAEVLVDDLKAVFFVKTLEGSKAPHNRPPEKSGSGKQPAERRISVTFMDNEVIEGYSHSFHLDRLGFFMNSIDPNDNNERIFVVLSYVKGILSDGKAVDLNAGMVSEKTCEFCGKKLDLRWKHCPFDGRKIK
ncbi:MAG: hypothetical protein HZA15_00140 [Nitrospirae bacterium]|nr:hypothetical protein [Nitrospirota bacterium]